MSCRIIVGDALDGLKTLPAESVQCVVTSPPYWGLRDYKAAGQLGLEKTPAAYVTALLRVFREVRRVLHPSGVLWLNLGDSFNAYNGNSGPGSSLDGPGKSRNTQRPKLETGAGLRTPGLKPKDMVGIPWRVAFALQTDGWWLRMDVIWNKPNPMPESITDRPTKAHEYLFLLTKSARYYYNAEAIAEPSANGEAPGPVSGWASGPGSHDTIEHNTGSMAGRRQRSRWPGIGAQHAAVRGRGETQAPMETHPTRNARSVWTIPTAPYPEAHFATFPAELPRRCILAGSRPADTVLDPFMGAGTTGLVARQLGRSCIGIELNPDYARLAKERIEGDCPLFENVALLTGGDGC